MAVCQALGADVRTFTPTYRNYKVSVTLSIGQEKGLTWQSLKPSKFEKRWMKLYSTGFFAAALPRCSSLVTHRQWVERVQHFLHII